MRVIVGLCLLVLAAPVLASNPGEPGPASDPPDWKGKHSDQLIASWGEPTKTKRRGKDGKVLVYKLRFFGEQVTGETKIRWSDAGIGPSPSHAPGRHQTNNGGPGDLIFAGGPVVIATQKVKFYVDREGIIQREEFAPRKWKKKP